MIRRTHELRSLPLWLLTDYLCELGGQKQAGDVVQGPGWRAQLTQMEDFQLGAIRVGEVRLELEIDEAVFDAFTTALEKKLLRAGG